MIAPLYYRFQGCIVVTGYLPDGDSIRFIPNDPSDLARLTRAHLLRVSARDQSVQLRLEGIDAPEVHYADAAQPRGAIARAALLEWLGVGAVTFAEGGATVISATPSAVPVTMLANTVDSHGRPIAYLHRVATHAAANDHERAQLHSPVHAAHAVAHDHERVQLHRSVHAQNTLHRRRAVRTRVDRALLRDTANYALVAAGHAYLLAYTSLPPQHRRVLRDAARAARAKRLGIWQDDATTRGFILRGRRSIGPHGTLIYPKLFRRCVDYLSRRAVGFRGTFVDWLSNHGSHGALVPDRVVTKHAANVPLSSLVHEQRGRIALSVDPLDLVFVES